VLLTIPSRDALAQFESPTGYDGQGTDKTPYAATTSPVDDKATRTLRDSIRRIRPGKSNKDRAIKALRSASWKDAFGLILAAAYQKIIIEGLLRRKPLPPSNDGRHIPLNSLEALMDERSQRPYISNFIRSSRYTAYNFVPKQLLFQFSKLGNFYFLVMGILQMIPGLSTVGRWTTIVPLSIFVAFSMLKEGYDDYRRYQLDKSENRSETWVLNRAGRQGPREEKASARIAKRAANDDADLESGVHDKTGEWLRVQWQHVKVGDVVRLRRNDGVPADMILLHATGPNGVAYIETMALDGETNLKSKQACPLVAEQCNTLHGIKSTHATIVSEDPNIDLYSYDGRVTVGDEMLPLSLNNIVYRGSILRNTTEAIGIVVNSGEECKIRMNANKNVTAKKPAMHSVINKMVLFQIVIVIMLAVGFTIGYSLWKKETQDLSFYLVSNGKWSANVPLKEIFFGYLIMFNTLIPLSLYISMEIIKIGQLILLQDVEMYDPVTDTPMVANTTTILENLGQVSYVFSDKTGTLTDNVMRFRKMSVAGVAFLHDMDVQRDEAVKQQKMESATWGRRNKGKKMRQVSPVSPHKGKMFEHQDQDDILEEDEEHDGPAPPKRTASSASASNWKSTVRPNEEPEVKTEDMLEYIRQKPNSVFARKAKQFLLCIALCHTCLPEKEEEHGDISFQAASPDELALVEAARDMGWLLIDRPAQTIKLQTLDDKGHVEVESYQVLDVIEFSSKRKRMSIIIRMPDGRICIFCKGADNVIMSRLKLSHLAEQKAKDINRRASMRKTFEQDKARTRMSMASGRGTPRTSMVLNRGESIDRLEGLRRSLGRLSTDVKRLSHSEAAVSPWVARRQQPDEMSTPRSSMDQLRHGRPSFNEGLFLDQPEHRIDESIAANEAAVFEQCFQHVDDFATEGLRTLLYAYRYIEEDAYASWKALYREAETSLVDRQELIEQAGEVIEQKFELAGATAIEDKLQEGVPETIDKLRRANIKVWMLTGDKRETAINIGHSARVCKPFSETYILDASKGNLQDTMTSTLNEVCRGMVPHSVVVVDGQTLATIDASDDLAVLFYDLVLRVDSVICCRASPSQKANLVTSIRRFVPSSMTLAIGDGANDIGMIQSSHVGIGISGREGLQASRISDYSIAQFRFLQQLMFVHGRWNYLRTGKYVLGTFWKEILFFLVQAHFQRYTGYSGTSLFESWSLTVFNSLFTSLPVILLGIFERDLSAETLLAVPELYTFGQQNRGFSFHQYFGWMFMGAAGSFVIYYFTFGEYWSALFTTDTSLYAMGALCFTVGVIFINIKLL
jgi:phospholipid-translocating ATPase